MTTATKKTICSKCGEVIFTYSDSFLADPFKPADAVTNVPFMDNYANGVHLLGCDNAIAVTVLPRVLTGLKGDLAAQGKTPKEIETELGRRKAFWLGKGE